MPVNISLVIITRNSEDYLGQCIASVGGFVNEIIVCDHESTDSTCEIAKSLGAKVFVVPNDRFFNRTRRYAIEQATGEWVLALDADERVPPVLLEELKSMMQENDYLAVGVIAMPWDFLFMRKWLRHGTWGSQYFIRLFRRDLYFQANPVASEHQFHNNFGALVELPRVKTKNRLQHYAYPTMHSFVYKTLWQYSKPDAESRYKRGERFSLRNLLIRPLKQFVASFFLSQGFRDGMHGFIAAVGLSIYHFLIVAHLYEIGMISAGPDDVQPNMTDVEG